MGTLTVKLLGPPDVRHGGRPADFRARKALALLAYLAAERGARSREEIIALLWPVSDGVRGRASLRSALAGLRGALGEAAEPPGKAHILADGGTLGLANGADLDLRTLKDAHALARATPRTGELEGDARRDAVSRLRSAAGAYRGEFLKGFSLDDAPDFDLWLDLQREAWRGRLGLVYDRLSGLLLEDGEPGEAIAAAAAWMEHAPLAEEAHRRLMEAQLAAGDRPGAVNTYETFRSVLKREPGTVMGPEIKALAFRLGEGAPARPPQRTPVPRDAARVATRSEGARVLPGTPFVGRSEEFGALVDAYRLALSGEARAVALVGDAGIGKTRLAEEFFSWAEAQGADVLRGRVHEVGGLPYGVLMDALRPRVERERAPDDLLEDVWLSELARLLPELGERYPDLPPPSGDEAQARARLFEAISRVVATLASGSRAPVVLFLDDLHWASRASLDALKYAGRRWAEDGVRVLVVPALRPEATENLPSSAGWLSELGRELPVERLELQPLAPGDTLDLLRALLGEGQAPESSGADLERLGLWLYEETGGQPLFLAETLKLLSGKGVLAVRTGADGEPAVSLGPAARDVEALKGLLPESVREAIRARLSRLGGGAWTFLAAGAVLDTGFTFERALQVADLEEGEGLEALDEALASRLMEEAGTGREPFGVGVYAFTHDKVRDVIYTEAGAARRRVFHRRVLEALEAAGSIPPAELARHALAAGLPGAVFRHSIAAADAAMGIFAARDAAVHYERARRLILARDLPVAPPASELERLHAGLGRSYELSEEWEKARDVYEALLSYARETQEPALECAALNHLAILTAKRSFELDTAKGLLGEALGVAERADDRIGLASTEWNMAETAVRALDPGSALAHGERALALARELGLVELRAHVLHVLAMTRAQIGDWDTAVAQAEESRELYAAMRERSPSPEGLATASSLVGFLPSSVLGCRAMEGENLALQSFCEAQLGRPREGADAGRAALAISGEVNEAWLRVNGSVGQALGVQESGEYGWMGLALGLRELGEYEEALLVAGRGFAQARAGDDPYIPLMLSVLGAAHQAALRLDDAREAYQEALELIGGVGKLYTLGCTANLCANRALADDWEAAHGRALESVALREEVFTVLFSSDLVCHFETEALLRGGDERLAREGVRRFGRRVGDNRRYRISYLRSLAVLARWQDDADTAAGHLREAGALAEEIGLPGELWQISARLGELYEGQGKRVEARTAFDRSARTLRWLAGKIGDHTMRSDFLTAPQALRILER